MNAVVATAATACAPSHRPVEWHQIDWHAVHKQVKRLQARITKATQAGKWGRVKALQRILTSSYSAKALAVRRVTENQGKRTPGVDRVLWSTPGLKSSAVRDLRRHGYKPMPLRRLYIPKANGKLRPLSIPTMKDRAMQALFLLALDPVHEVVSDRNSYGFRKGRSAFDAAEACHHAGRLGPKAKNGQRSAEWVLEGDIKGCFDHISHSWLIDHVPMDKVILRKWLAAGFMEAGSFHSTDEGTPQGGIISPCLANFALDGMQTMLKKLFTHVAAKKAKVNMVRYADDFVITAATPELLKDTVQPAVERFLAVRGLKLSPEKTKITHIEQGYDFLGYTVRRMSNRLLLRPSDASQKALLKKVREVVKNLKPASQVEVINALNPMLRGWANYHRHNAAKATFNKLDHRIWECLWRWAYRRHPTKRCVWIKNRYFVRVGNQNWRFGCREKGANATLIWLANIKVARHFRVIGEANPYDPRWSAYFDERAFKRVQAAYRGRTKHAQAHRTQQGICPGCGEPLDIGGLHLHHVIERQHGGTDEQSNLRLLHETCHLQHHHGRKLEEPVTHVAS